MPQKVQRTRLSHVGLRPKKRQVIKQKQHVTQKVIVNIPAVPKLRRSRTYRKKVSSVSQIPPVAGLTGYLPVSKRPDTEAWQKLNKSSVTVEDVTEKLQPKMLEFAKQLRLEQAKDNDAMKQLIFHGAEQIQQALHKQRPAVLHQALKPSVIERMSKTEALAKARAARASKAQAKKDAQAARVQSAPSQAQAAQAEALQEEESKIEDELKESKEVPPSQAQQEVGSTVAQLVQNIESAMDVQSQPKRNSWGGARTGAGRHKKQ